MKQSSFSRSMLVHSRFHGCPEFGPACVSYIIHWVHPESRNGLSKHDMLECACGVFISFAELYGEAS